MPKFVIERNIPGAGALTDEQFTSIAQKSCSSAAESWDRRCSGWNPS